MYDIMHGSISPVDMIGNAHHDIFKKIERLHVMCVCVCMCVYVMCCHGCLWSDGGGGCPVKR